MMAEHSVGSEGFSVLSSGGQGRLDQPARMHRFIRVFAWRTCSLVGSLFDTQFNLFTLKYI